MNSINHGTTRAGRLQYLCNKYGSFKVARAFMKPNEEPIWSKHREVLECWESEKGIQWLGLVNNRQILPCEIVLDLDNKPTLEHVNHICDKLDALEENYIAYFTGSKGYHIHMKHKSFNFMTKSQKEQYRQKFLSAFSADLHKKSEVMIALEDAPHWKTGKLKTEIRRSKQWEDF
jgi:hypothetical protein